MSLGDVAFYVAAAVALVALIALVTAFLHWLGLPAFKGDRRRGRRRW